MFISIPRDATFGHPGVEEYFNLNSIITITCEIHHQRYQNLYAHLTAERTHGKILERYYATEATWQNLYDHLQQHTSTWLHFEPTTLSHRYLIINPQHVLAVRCECDDAATSGIMAGLFLDLPHDKKIERLYQKKADYDSAKTYLQQTLNIFALSN